MMTEDLAMCPKCGYKNTLRHYSSDGVVNWLACPRCRSFNDNDGKLKEEKDEIFWKHIEEDTGFREVGK